MKKNKLIIILVSLVLVITVVFIGLFVSTKYEAKEIINRSHVFLKKTSNKYYLDPLIKDENKDTVGWIKVEGTEIDYPVVQYSDNEYYLNHDFYNDRNSNGWVFLDSKSKLDDQNLIVYGQFNLDGSIFGTIDEVFKVSKEKKKDVKKIIFITDKDYFEYNIFSAYIVNENDKYNNRKYDNLSETLKIFKERSEIPFNDSLDGVDHIITLSTINEKDNDRMVIHGYKKK